MTVVHLHEPSGRFAVTENIVDVPPFLTVAGKRYRLSDQRCEFRHPVYIELPTAAP